MDISQKIYRLRTESGMTQQELAKVAGVSDKAVSAWEKGLRDPKLQPLRRICEYFHIDLNVFIDTSSDVYKSDMPANLRPLQPMQKIPLVGTIACGEPILAQENISDYVDLPGHIRADFALTCKGDSMINAGIRDGDVVYIRQQEAVENGQIAAVLVDKEEATLKRFYILDGHISLNAENPEFPPLVFSGEDAHEVRVLGLAVAYTHVI